MAVKKDRIVLGDSYHVSYTCYTRDGSMRKNDHIPVIPLAAEVSLWNVIDQVFVPLNEHGDLEISIIPDENKVDYVIPADVLVADGDYKCYISFIFDINGAEHRTSQIRSFRVQAKE